MSAAVMIMNGYTWTVFVKGDNFCKQEVSLVFQIGSYIKGSKFFPLSVAPHRERRQIFVRVISLEGISIPIKMPLYKPRLHC